MKKLLLIFCSAFLFVLILTFSFSGLTSSAASSDPSYTSDAVSEFNDQYFVNILDVSFYYPTGFSNSNIDLNGFYPVIIGHSDLSYVYFSRSVGFVCSEYSLTVKLNNAFAVKVNGISKLDLSTVSVPETLSSVSFTYTLNSSNQIVDNLGRVSVLLYLPCDPDIQDLEHDSRLWVNNQFSFPTVGDYPPENEITYEPVLSTDINMEFSSYDAFSYDEGDFSNAVDIEGVISELDPDIGEAKGGFHKLFEYLTSSLRIGPVITLLLTVAFAFYVLGRL